MFVSVEFLFFNFKRVDRKRFLKKYFCTTNYLFCADLEFIMLAAALKVCFLL